MKRAFEAGVEFQSRRAKYSVRKLWADGKHPNPSEGGFRLLFQQDATKLFNCGQTAQFTRRNRRVICVQHGMTVGADESEVL